MRLGALAATFATAAAGSWRIIADDVGTIATGIAFNADGKTGFLPADSNGVGATLLRSTDGGISWDYSAPHPFQLLFLDVASAGANVIAAGVLGVDFSIDGGETFNTSLSNEVDAQCTRNLFSHDAPAGFGLAGTFGLLEQVNGVAISTDFGITFTTYNANASSDARYAAFPDPNIWMVASGDWPESNAAAADELPAGHTLVKKRSQKLWLLREEATGKLVHHFNVGVMKQGAGQARALQSSGSSSSSSTPTNPDGPTEFLYQITVTQDGGKSFATVSNITGEIYPNGVECTTPQSCCVVAEADSGAFAGSYILCTQDSGASWTRAYNNTDPGSSLMDIAAVSDTEFWAVGGEFNSVGPAYATFLHSTDSGASWSVESTIPNVYATAIDCVPATGTCWATVLSLLQESSVVSQGNFSLPLPKARKA